MSFTDFTIKLVKKYRSQTNEAILHRRQSQRNRLTFVLSLDFYETIFQYPYEACRASVVWLDICASARFVKIAGEKDEEKSL